MGTATPKQLNYIKQLLEDTGLDLLTVTKAVFWTDRLHTNDRNELSLSNASAVIDHLKKIKERGQD